MNIKKWFNDLLDPEKTPSSATLISLCSGLTGVIISILPFFIKEISMSETVETSRWLIGFGIGGKTLQHLSRKQSNQGYRDNVG